MSKKLAILQSNYIPWKGNFDLINSVDEFILYDTAQYTKNDWRNRNKIKTPKGPAWLTIPVRHQFGQTIQETQISDPIWARRHWDLLRQNYAAAPYFGQYKAQFQLLYAAAGDEKLLSLVNHRFLVEICRILEIKTPITWSRDYSLADGQTERLVDLCRQTGADEYLSGPAARAYLRGDLLEAAGVKLSYIDYANYPEYHQLFPPFEHAVTILDLIFNEGPNAAKFMKSFNRRGVEAPLNGAR